MRLATFSAALVAGLLGPGVASAQPAPGQQSAVSFGPVVGDVTVHPRAAPGPNPQPRQDSVTGTSTLYLSPDDVFGAAGFTTLEARSGPAGENPTGTFTAHFGGGSGPDYSGTVTCLSVIGRRAVVGVEGTYDPPFGPPPLPFAGIVMVFDGGPVASRPPWPDTFAFSQIEPPGPRNCSAPNPPPNQTLAATDITVLDARLPTTEEECKHGGYAAFGFKNQRRCIRFVRLIPGPEPYPTTKDQCRHGGWAQFGFRNERRCLRFVRLMPKP